MARPPADEVAAPLSGPARTVADLWLRGKSERRSTPAYLAEAEDGWREVGWEDVARRVDRLAGGFLALGIRSGDRVALMCRTRLEWTLCDFALASVGAVVVPVYTVSSRDERAYILADSGARLLVSENAAEYAEVEPGRDQLAALEQLVAIDPFPEADLSLDELEERGREHLRLHPDALAEAREAVGEDDPFTIVYTSGTTGPPKGCVLTHRNWCSMVETIRRVPDLVRPSDRVLLHLPLAHVFARLVELLGARVGFTIAFCPNSAALPRALRTARPTIFPTVPRVYETFHQTIRARFEEARGRRRWLIDRALAAGREAARRRQADERLGLRLSAELAVADRLVYSKVKDRLGGNLRFAVSGGAPLPRELAEFFGGLDILVLEGYGLTESAAVVSVNQPDRYRFGTVGPPAPGVEVRIAADGEVLVRGENVFRGYYGDEETTRAVLEDGWLRTGDVGTLDDEGFLTIVGREKEIIVTSNGANIPPENIENALKGSKYISQALVVGDRRPHLVALLTLNRREIRKDTSTDEEVQALVKRVVADVNNRLGPEERVRRFAILDRDFLPEEGEVTPTLKLKRHVLEERFRAEIDALYAPPRAPSDGS